MSFTKGVTIHAFIPKKFHQHSCFNDCTCRTSVSVERIQKSTAYLKSKKESILCCFSLCCATNIPFLCTVTPLSLIYSLHVQFQKWYTSVIDDRTTLVLYHLENYFYRQTILKFCCYAFIFEHLSVMPRRFFFI